MSRIFRSWCFWRRTATTQGQFGRNLTFAEPELIPGSLAGAKSKMAESRSNFLQRIFHRQTKEEEILLLEKRYLKKYLRHYQLYLDHMTLPEMRMAKRCLEDSLSSSTESTPEPSLRYTSTPKYKSVRPSKHVTFHRNLARYIPMALDDGSSYEDSGEEISTQLPVVPEGEFDFGPFLLGGDNGPTYVSFEQPEP